ncbi:hypothetical protein [Providencia alcalifaciens]|uniref:hypothetical protein n=1 Tax=Providencia alcalifaciens TaxID=126385 RepID=UPI0004478A24|nr:hypothetical protein [Providencia alcalifaciens]EUC94938.1 hypothetical protein HMPREF1567_2325 [Providencia alcalifaciens PAL-2]MTB32124.1 hypothetical protein [Providencia alcalifaciens]MTC97737.1 hypothetical protein [Providencia alcalifaciens]
MKEQQVKLSKLFKSGRWFGYGLTVDGKLLSNQKEVSFTTTPLGENNSVVVEFACNPSMMADAPDIHLD